MANRPPSLLVAALAAIVAGALGPRIVGPQDRAAGAPFVYTPPEGFVPATEENHKAILGRIVGGQKVWINTRNFLELYTPNITLTHTDKTGMIGENEIAALGRGMPDLFAQSGVTWTEVRHDTRVRPDKTRVALIEGECTKGELHYRALQMVFPDDSGTSIVTASFATETAPRWEPAMEASMNAATGVALRVGPPENWLYVAWGVGGGILGFLAMGLAARPMKKKEAD